MILRTEDHTDRKIICLKLNSGLTHAAITPAEDWQNDYGENDSQDGRHTEPRKNYSGLKFIPCLRNQQSTPAETGKKVIDGQNDPSRNGRHTERAKLFCSYFCPYNAISKNHARRRPGRRIDGQNRFLRTEDTRSREIILASNYLPPTHQQSRPAEGWQKIDGQNDSQDGHTRSRGNYSALKLFCPRINKSRPAEDWQND